MSRDGDIHGGHRERMRDFMKRYAEDGIPDSKMLEFLLFNSIPRGDTNPLAHALLEHFGSFAAVLDADEEELLQVPGVGRKTARMLSMMPAVMRTYWRSKNRLGKIYDTLEKLGEYGVRLFSCLKAERVFGLYFDNKMRLLDEVQLASGGISSAAVKTKEIVSEALRLHAANVVLMHNHPDGLALPSGEDYAVTETVRAALAMFDITLAEHFVVAGNRFYPMLHVKRQNPAQLGGDGGAVFEVNL